jgi:hypothetical protein
MRCLLVLALVPLLSSCGGGGGRAAEAGGTLEGTVFRAPATPTCVKGQPCSRPAPGVTLHFSRSGSTVVGGVRTRNDGTYRVSLSPGRYSVSAAQPVRPRQVSVPREGVRRVDFTLETKIR